MCGICGFVWEDKILLKKMTDSISHRGPDDDGYHTDRHVSLGMRRLSIIDLSKGEQPIFNEDGSVCVVFNGEIYNFQTVRETLVKKGHRFATNSDTEVIVHAYEEYGQECVRHFNGMFGFALWDSKKKELMLAVDRIGIKPLYYSVVKGKLIFASEIKALLQHKGIKREVNRKALIDYLTFRYTPTQQTLFEGIFKLPPGHLMVFGPKGMKIQKYWDPKTHSISERSEDYYSKKIIDMLKESVRLQMISDVPLGVYLSGGLDSSLVTAFMKTFTDSEIKTFSVAFEGPEPFNESRYSRMLADHYGTDHHELIVGADSIKPLPVVIWHLDDLDNDPTMIAQYLLSEFTRKNVKVVLTGEGADELFGGYDEFKFMTVAQRYRKAIPMFALKGAVKGVQAIPGPILDKFFHFSSSLGEKGKERLEKFVESLGNHEQSYMALTSFFSDEEKKELYSDALHKVEMKQADYKDQLRPFFDGADSKNLLDKLIYLDMKRRLPYHLLHKLDKMAMAHSIEGRVPFLDHNLIEFSFEIPPHLKLRGFEQKYILRKAARQFIPKQIMERKKHPFVAPIDMWFKQGLKDVAKDILSKSEVCKGRYFRKEAVQKIMDNYHRSPLYYGRQLFGGISFDIWHKIYIENDDMKKPQLNLGNLYG